MSDELKEMNLTTPEKMLKNTYRFMSSYTKEPYPGRTLFWTPDVPAPTFPVCIPCHSDTTLPTNPILKVRGLCKQTAFDIEYTMIVGETGYIELVGLRNSVIKYNMDAEEWVIQSLLNPKTTATSKAVFSTLFIGKHTWHVSNDKKCQAGKAELSVKLSNCVEGQFSCGDGECIDIDQRCDRVKHCADRSDELDCKTVEIPPGYQQEFVPIKLEEDLSITKVETVVGVAIKDVINIFEKEGSIGLRFTLSMEW